MRYGQPMGSGQPVGYRQPVGGMRGVTNFVQPRGGPRSFSSAETGFQQGMGVGDRFFDPETGGWATVTSIGGGGSAAPTAGRGSVGSAAMPGVVGGRPVGGMPGVSGVPGGVAGGGSAGARRFGSADEAFQNGVRPGDWFFDPQAGTYVRFEGFVTGGGSGATGGPNGGPMGVGAGGSVAGRTAGPMGVGAGGPAGGRRAGPAGSGAGGPAITGAAPAGGGASGGRVAGAPDPKPPTSTTASSAPLIGPGATPMSDEGQNLYDILFSSPGSSSGGLFGLDGGAGTSGSADRTRSLSPAGSRARGGTAKGVSRVRGSGAGPAVRSRGFGGGGAAGPPMTWDLGGGGVLDKWLPKGAGLSEPKSEPDAPGCEDGI